MSKIWCVLVVWVALLQRVDGQAGAGIIIAVDSAEIAAGAEGAEAAGVGSTVDESSIAFTSSRATFQGQKQVEAGEEAQQISIESSLNDGEAMATVDSGFVSKTVNGIVLLNDGATGRGINPLSTSALGDYFGRGGASVDPKVTWPYGSRPAYMEPETNRLIEETGPEFDGSSYAPDDIPLPYQTVVVQDPNEE